MIRKEYPTWRIREVGKERKPFTQFFDIEITHYKLLTDGAPFK